ncbi:hypothetical protein LTR56_000113 [Elasticomyces elasticus]|nr:hypothetical protein LTR56_000113 [Elasticomyces elasticus]KAK3667101.1 hypothetical protein LTR22_001965 [Elasticomyces elasticus]KAK4932876.1 hypothetical protein LTR49_000832 [Elasticomyces elasticus]KAK5768720.1 hypothetical protein LTS12_001146 [Elasticomyces elasticus]
MKRVEVPPPPLVPLTPFRLLDLYVSPRLNPAELWSAICAFALSDAYPSTLYLHEDMHAGTLHALTQQPNLLRTCRALRSECLPLLYEKPVFLLIEANMLSPNWRLWLEMLAPDSRHYMQNLYVTSTHQDLITHLTKNYLLPYGCEINFAEPVGHDALPLGDFTYKVTLPPYEEVVGVPDEFEVAIIEPSGTTAAQPIDHVDKKVQSRRRKALSKLCQDFRVGPPGRGWL